MASFPLADGGTVYVQGFQCTRVLSVPSSPALASLASNDATPSIVVGTPAAVAAGLGTPMVAFLDASGAPVYVNPVQAAEVTDVPPGLTAGAPLAYITAPAGSRVVVQGTAAATAAALGL